MAKKQPELILSMGVQSVKGRRDENQDKMSAFPTPLGTAYVVADGMGGYRGGAEASRRVIDGFQNYLNATGFTESISPQEMLQRAAQQTNTDILAASTAGDPSVEGMGSTVVMALLRAVPGGQQMITAHIGDSRAYLLRNGSLYRITRDHSMVQRMVDTGLLTPEQAQHHPESNVLSRAIGKQPTVEIDVSEIIQLCPGDVVMLCSDGLWGPLTDQQIGELLSRDAETQKIADALVDLALECGSDDNITVQVVRYEYQGLGARSAASFHANSKNVAPLLPPSCVVAGHELFPGSKLPLSAARRRFTSSDLIFGSLGALVVVALCVIGYQVLKPMLHKQTVVTPEPAQRPQPLSKPSPATPGANAGPIPVPSHVDASQHGKDPKSSDPGSQTPQAPQINLDNGGKAGETTPANPPNRTATNGQGSTTATNQPQEPKHQ